jgi:hypothetical protein
MKRLLALPLTLFTGLLICTAATAATYKWVDEKGNVHYSQHPPADTNYERMKIEKSRPGETPPPAPPASGSTNKAGGSSSSSEVVKEELSKNEEIRAKNCEAAKKNLEIYTVYKRYKDKEGNVVRMDDDERLKKIEESKQHISEFCD